MMKQLFGSMFLLGGVFLFGVSQTNAAELPTEPPNALLIEHTTQESLETTKIILIADPDLLNTYVKQFLLDQTRMDASTQNAEFGRTERIGGLGGGGDVGTGRRDITIAPMTLVPTSLLAPTSSPTLARVPEQASAPTPTSTTTPTPSAVLTLTPTPAAPQVAAPTPKTLQLTELYPNTIGDDKTEEYVRVQNSGSQMIDLSGWMLKDASGKTYTVSESTQLAPGATFQISRANSNITLNNDEDEVFLVAPDGETIDRVAYVEALEGDVLKKTADGWKWPVHPAANSVNAATATPLSATTTTTAVTPAVAATPSATTTMNSPAPAATPAPVVVTPPVVTAQSVAPVAPATLASTPKTLSIVALYPNTTNNDETEEYVRLKNTGDLPVNLSGWMLKDSSDKTYTFPQTEPLAPDNTIDLLRPQTKLTLNNDVDKIVLIAPDGQSVDSLSYASASKGELYKKVGDKWFWSSQIPTVQPAAVFERSNPVPESTSPTTHTNNAAPSESLTIEKIKTLPDATVVDVTGTVTVVPGRLGKQFFYVQENGNGIQVYKNDADFPDVKVGTRVRIKGVMSASGEERRIKVDKTGSIESLESGNEPIVEQKKTSELRVEDIGKLARVFGMLVTVSTDHMTIEQDGYPIEIGVAAGTNIDTSAFKAGDELEVTGIVRPLSKNVKLMPREQGDLVVKIKTPLVTGTIASGKEAQTKQDQKIAGLIAAASGTIFVIWMIRHFVRKQHTLYAHHPIATTAETIH